MKTNVLLIFFFLTSLTTMAQRELIDILSDETCECLKTFEVDGKGAEQIQIGMGVCMMEKAGPYLDRIKSEMGIDLLKDGEEGGRQLA